MKDAPTSGSDHQPADRDRLLSTDEAAALLRASRSKLYRLVRAGSIPGYKVGATYVFYLGDLHDYVRRGAAAPPDPSTDDGARARRRRQT